MPDPGSIPLAELLSSFSSIAVFLLMGAALLVLWQLAILLGAIIANLRHRAPEEGTDHLKVG